MRIGIPCEVRPLEGRVALTPQAGAELVAAGHRVLVESGAGRLSGFDDDMYRAAGVEVATDADALFAGSELLVKVKEPQAEEFERLSSNHLLFCYLHLAALPDLIRKLLDIGLTAVGFEVVNVAGRLPLLAPMSAIAGRLSSQIGANLLHRPNGGKGVLLGGVHGAGEGRVVIIGGGTAGSNAAEVALGLGARVSLFEPDAPRRRDLGDRYPGIEVLALDEQRLAEQVAGADLLIGAALIPGARAPHVVSADMVRRMQAGSVVMDISVDQGGCIETSRATDYRQPTFVWEDVLHFGVTNMPGAVPRTASEALSHAVLPYVRRIAEPDWQARHADLAGAIYVQRGKLVHEAIFGLI